MNSIALSVVRSFVWRESRICGIAVAASVNVLAHTSRRCDNSARRWVWTVVTPSSKTSPTLLIVFLLTGLFVVLPDLSVTSIGKIPITGLDEHCICSLLVDTSTSCGFR